MIINRLKAILGFLLNLIKRSLCFFRRRRKSSADVVPLTDIGIVPNYQEHTGNENSENYQQWNDWTDGPKKPQTIEEHIEQYRNTRNIRLKSDVEEPQPDFFQDMEPKIKRQMKMVLKSNEPNLSSRLSYVPDDVLPNDCGELKSWEETENREGDWVEGSEMWNFGEVLRQSRREEKKKKYMEREQRRTAVS